MKLRPCRALLVVAETGIDQDRVLTGFDNKGVKAEHQLTARGLDQPWSQQIAVRPHDLGVEIGEEVRRGKKWPLKFGYAMDLKIADMRRLHLPLRKCSPRKGTPTPW